MQTNFKLFCLALPIIIAFDASWIGVIAGGFYHDNLGPILLPHPNLLAALAFYVIYVVGIIFFALRPALQAHSLAKAVMYGAMLGLVSYATCDLTNVAAVQGWPVIIAVVDMAWGVILTGVVSGLTYVLATKVFKI